MAENDFQGYSLAELREQLKDAKLPALREAGLLTPSTVSFLESYCQHYEPGTEPHYEEESMADEPNHTDRYVNIVRRDLGVNLSKAVKNGNYALIQHAIGMMEQDSVDAGQLEWVEFVDKILKPDDRNHMMNLAITSPPPPEGPTGVGKSYTGYSIIETSQYIADITYASNNSTDPFKTLVSWTQLVHWLKNTPGQKLFMWDEAAQVLMYDDQVSGRELALLIRLLRKFNCHLILIGHTGMGIPKDTRRMLSFIQKQDQKSAIYGVGLEEQRNGWMEITEELERIENIPATTIEYDDIGDEGKFRFNKDESTDSGDVDSEEDTVDSEKVEAVVDYLDTDDGLRAVADRHDTNHETLRNWVNEYTGDD